MTTYLDRTLPQNAALISGLAGPHLDRMLIRGTERTYLPIRRAGEYVNRSPAAGWPVATEDLDSLVEAVSRGVPYFIVDDPETRRGQPVRDLLGSRFTLEEKGQLRTPTLGNLTLYQLAVNKP